MFPLCLLATASNCNLHQQMRIVPELQNTVLTNETRTRHIILWSLHRLKMLNSASIVTGLWTGCLEFDAWLRHKFSMLPKLPDLPWGSPISYPMDTGSSFLGGRTAEARIWPHPYMQDLRLHCKVDETCTLLGYYGSSCGNSLLMFGTSRLSQNISKELSLLAV